ncbi:MAG: hypothetical protein ACREAE_00785, partial [Nitrosopumilaceae archaeon]
RFTNSGIFAFDFNNRAFRFIRRETPDFFGSRIRVRLFMLKKNKKQIEKLPNSLYDLDITESGLWIGVTAYGEGQSLLFGSKAVALPQQLGFPLVRAIDDETALVINSRTGWLEKNAWIITSAGEVNAHFYAGDAVQDLLASKTFLVVTYFDESAYISSMIEGNGVAIFDIEGNFLFGYKDLFGDEAVDVADCYAACWAEENHVLFFPYTDFPLVSFDLESKTQKVWKTPSVVVGSDAISSLGDRIYFHSPYRDESGIYEWQIGNESAQRINSYSSHLRGLPKGQFLAVGKAGYTIVSMPEI